MTAVTRNPIGRLTLSAALVLPLAAMACGGDESTASVREAEARSVTPIRRVEPTTTLVVRTPSGTPVPPKATPEFETAADAYIAGEFRAAATMYKVHVATTPDDALGYYMLGLSSWKAGDFTGAKEALDRSIALNPGSAKTYFNQARVLLDLKRFSEALETIEKGRGIDSTTSEGVRLTARAQAESGDVEGALDTYRDLLIRDEADAWGLNNFGMLMLDRGEFLEALGPLARAVQVRPTAPLFHNNLGMALERAGYPITALRHYELAEQHDSTFTKAAKNVARLRALITEGTPVDEVSVPQLAEQFRGKVKAWKEGLPRIEVPPIDLR